MTLINDFPRVRAGELCPVCRRSKPVGCLACWPCYREHDFRNGEPPQITRMLDDLEAALAHPKGRHVPAPRPAAPHAPGPTLCPVRVLYADGAYSVGYGERLMADNLSQEQARVIFTRWQRHWIRTQGEGVL